MVVGDLGPNICIARNQSTFFERAISKNSILSHLTLTTDFGVRWDALRGKMGHYIFSYEITTTVL